MWQLIINGPGYFDTAYELPDGETLLGRADENDIILSGNQVSRRHARFFFEKDKLFFEDLGSRNGTRANGSFLVEPHEVQDKDVFTIGENSLAVSHPAEFEVAKDELEGRADAKKSDAEKDNGIGEVLLSRSLDDNEFIKSISMMDQMSTKEFEMMPFLDNFGSSTGGASVQGKTLKAVKAAKRDKVMDQKELMLFIQVSERLNNAKDLHTFMDDVLGMIVEIAQATTAVAMMLDEKGNLTPSIVRTKDGKTSDDMPISRSIVGEVARKKIALAVMNAQSDKDFSNSESVIMYGLEQVICAPLLRDNEFIGVIYLNRPASTSPKSMKLPRLVDMVNAMGHMMVTGVEKWAKRENAHAEEVRNKRLACFHSAETVKRLLSEGDFAVGNLKALPVTAMVIRLHGLLDACLGLPIESASALVEDYYDVVRRIAHKYNGTLGSFMGEGVLVAFGAPYGAPDDADRALACARACRKDCAALLNQMLPQGPSCDLKVSLGTGTVLAGPVGTPEDFEYVLLGAPIELAKEMHAVDLSDAILVTDDTLQAMTTAPDVEDAGVLEIGGKTICVKEVVASAVASNSVSRRASNKGAPLAKPQLGEGMDRGEEGEDRQETKVAMLPRIAPVRRSEMHSAESVRSVPRQDAPSAQSSVASAASVVPKTVDAKVAPKKVSSSPAMSAVKSVGQSSAKSPAGHSSASTGALRRPLKAPTASSPSSEPRSAATPSKLTTRPLVTSPAKRLATPKTPSASVAPATSSTPSKLAPRPLAPRRLGTPGQSTSGKLPSRPTLSPHKPTK